MTKHGHDLKTKIAGWLETKGYPLEMAVARAFRERPFRVHQSHFFIDPKTSKNREIDVLVSRQGDIDGRIIRIVFVIECKKSRDKPWVVFTDSSTHLADSSRVCQRAASPFGKKLLAAFAMDPLLAETGIFGIPKRSGYAVTTALGDDKEDGKDRAYYAISSVAMATSALTKLLHQTPLAAVFFPIVVLDGHLFDCHLGHDSETVVEELSKVVLLWRNPMMSMPHTIIHLVTLSELNGLVDDADKIASNFLRLDAKQVGRALGRPSARIKVDDPMIDF
jgi:hypothetical protein